MARQLWPRLEGPLPRCTQAGREQTPPLPPQPPNPVPASLWLSVWEAKGQGAPCGLVCTVGLKAQDSEELRTDVGANQEGPALWWWGECTAQGAAAHGLHRAGAQGLAGLEVWPPRRWERKVSGPGGSPRCQVKAPALSLITQ